jgi:methionyl-tRNA synthetase
MLRLSAEWPAVWGALPDGTVIQKGATLFPRLDPDRSKELLDKWRAARRAEAEKQSQQSAATTAAVPATPALLLPPLQPRRGRRCQRSPSTSLSAWICASPKCCRRKKCPKKDRLLQVELDLGPLGKRQVVAGIAELSTPESLVGKSVVLLCNLKPAKIGGLLSAGMILALGDEKLLGLAGPDREVPPGTALR